MATETIDITVADDNIMTAIESSNEEVSDPIVKEELALESDEINNTGNSHSSSFTENLSSEIKPELINVRPEGDTLAVECTLSNVVVSDVNLFKEEDIEDDVEEDIVERIENVPPTLIGNSAVTVNCENGSAENDLKLHKEEDIEDIVEEDFVENMQDIKEDGDEEAETSVDSHAMNENHENNLAESDTKSHKEEDVEEAMEEVESDVKGHKEGDVEEVMEETVKENFSCALSSTIFSSSAESCVKFHEEGIKETEDITQGSTEEKEEDKKVVQTSCDKFATVWDQDGTKPEGKLLKSSTKWQQICEKYERKFYSKFGVFPYDAKSGLYKNENDSVKYPVDKSQPSRVFYDSRRIKLVDVSVVLEDLFSEIARRDPQKPLQRHVGSKPCPRMFCTRKFKFSKSMKAVLKTSRNKKARKRTKTSAELSNKNVRDSAVCVSSDAATERIVNSSGSKNFPIDELQQSRTHYDSNTQLVDVSVVLEDLFEEISRLDPQKAVQKHINSKSCPCMFCTRNSEPLNKSQEENASIEATKSSHCIEEHLGESADKWNSCTICPARFRFMYSLTRHSAMNHRVYLCSECSRKFSLESDLDTHLKTHPANKLHFCVLCSFKGRVEAELEIHARTHTTEKLFSCSQCLVEFKKNCNLLRHINEPTNTEATPEVKCKISLRERPVLRQRKKPVVNDAWSESKQTSLSSSPKEQSSSQTSCLSEFNKAHNPESNFTNASAQSFSYDFTAKKFVTRSKVEHRPVSYVSKCLVSNQSVAPVNKLTDSLEVNVPKTLSEPSHSVEHPAQLINKRWNSCAICPARFRFMFSLTKHCAITHRVYLCPECHGNFQHESVLQTHLKTHPSIEYFCVFCPFKSRVEAELEVHARTHATEKLFSCAKCLAEFDRSYTMLDHIREKCSPRMCFDSTGTKLINVSVVLEDLFQKLPQNDSQEPIQRHINSKLCPCVFCTGKFKLHNKTIIFLETEVNKNTTQSNSQSEKYASKPNKKWNCCTLCPARFRFVHSLRRHSAADHFVFLCPECPSRFQAKPDFQTHMRTHLGNQPYSCAFCSFKSKLEAELKMHARIHSKEKLFSCAKCFIEFDRSSSLLAHIQEHASTGDIAKDKNRIILLNDKLQLNETPSNLKSKSLASKQTICHTRFKPHLECESSAHIDTESFSNNGAPSESRASSDLGHCYLTGIGQCLSSGVPKDIAIKGQCLTLSVPNDITMKTQHLHSDVSNDITMKNQYVPSNVSNDVTMKDQHLSSGGPNDITMKAQCQSLEVRNDIFKKSQHLSFNVPNDVTINVTDEDGSLSRVSNNILSSATSGATFESKLDIGSFSVNSKPASANCASVPQTGHHLDPHFAVEVNNKSFRCPHCIATFKFGAHLRQHLVAHSNDRPFSCPQCGASFKRKRNLSQHLAVHSSQNYTCPNCGATFKQERSLKNHLKIHSNKKPYSCPQFGATFQQKEILNEHLVVHADNLPFKSNMCTVTPKSIKKAQRNLDLSYSRPFPCPHCKAKFKHKQSLNKHLALHSDKNPSVDVMCPATFNSSKDIQQHSGIHSDAKLCSCPHCDVNLKYKSSLKEHLTTHSDNKPFTCAVCTTTFKSNQGLKRHLVVHSNSRPFSCPHCLSKFKRKDYLKTHLALVHSTTKPFSDQLNATFNMDRQFHQHLAVHSDQKLFSCADCRAAFKSKVDLWRHSVIHVSERPFSCSHCVATFKRKDRLARHSAVHSNKKPHPSAPSSESKFSPW